MKGNSSATGAAPLEDAAEALPAARPLEAAHRIIHIEAIERDKRNLFVDATIVARALLAAHSELERVREALTAINRRLSNGGLTFDELIREAAYSASIARAALSPQPPKEERVTPSELEAAHRQGYIAGQVEEAARRSPAIRREALEEAARVAERIWDEGQQGAHGGEQAIRTAAAIRSLMDAGLPARRAAQIETGDGWNERDGRTNL